VNSLGTAWSSAFRQFCERRVVGFAGGAKRRRVERRVQSAIPTSEVERVERGCHISNEVYQVENGFHARDADMLVALHRQAGFGDVQTELVSEVASRADGTPWTRHYNFLLARP
jgi:hypothetical protein